MIIKCSWDFYVTFWLHFLSDWIFVMAILDFWFGKKSPSANTRKSLFWNKLPKLNSKFVNSNSSCEWLRDLYRETKLQILSPISNWKVIHSCRSCILRTLQAKHFLWYKHRLVCYEIGNFVLLICVMKFPNGHYHIQYTNEGMFWINELYRIYR